MVFQAPPPPSSSLNALVDVELNPGNNNRRAGQQSRNHQHQHQHQHQYQYQQQQQQQQPPQRPPRHDWQQRSDLEQLAFFHPPLSPAPPPTSSPSFPTVQSSGHPSASRRTPVPERNSPLHQYPPPPLPPSPQYHQRPFGSSSALPTGSGTTTTRNHNPLDLDQYPPYPHLPSRGSSMAIGPPSPTGASTLNGSPNFSSGNNSNPFRDQSHFNGRESYPPRSFDGPAKYPTTQRQGLRGPPSPMSPTVSTSTTLRQDSATFPSPTMIVKNNRYSTANSTTTTNTADRRFSISSRNQTFSVQKTSAVSKPRVRKYKNFFRKRNSDGTLRYLTYREIEMVGLGRMAQFSNERLYLHWIRFGVLQGSIAVLLLSFGIGVAAYVGCGALIFALLTLVYGTTLYHKRHLYMVTKRQDVDYYVRRVPTLLTVGLFLLYAGNFALQLIYGMEARSPPPWTQQDDGNFKDAF